MAVPGVLNCHHIASRGVLRQQVFIDLHLFVDVEDLISAQKLTERVQTRLDQKFCPARCTILLEPRDYVEEALPTQESMDESKWGPDPLKGLTDIQRFGLEAVLSDVNAADGWSWQRPVLLRNRCWMQLNQIQLDQLHRFLPPDGHAESPELVHYQTLVREGIDPLVAQQSCWDEFGIDDCQRALQTFWISQKSPNHGWTAHRYRSLVSLYRDCIERGINTIPMLVLARQGSSEPHQLHWLTASPPVMRHTCA